MVALSLGRVAHNEAAAWRSGGFHYTLCGARLFQVCTTVVAGFSRHCAKPHVGCCRTVAHISNFVSYATHSG